MSKDDLEKLTEKHAVQLSEHFESVIILGTRLVGDGERYTEMVFKSRGNWYAHKGMMEEWLTRADERTRKEVREDEDA